MPEVRGLTQLTEFPGVPVCAGVVECVLCAQQCLGNGKGREIAPVSFLKFPDGSGVLEGSIFTLFLGLDCSVGCFFFVTLVATKNILPMLKRALQLSFAFRIKSKVFILPHRVWCS